MEKTLQIKEFDSNDRDFIINGLMALQEHEVALHDTRRVASRDLCEKYFEEIYENALAYNGALLLGCVEGVPADSYAFGSETILRSWKQTIQTTMATSATSMLQASIEGRALRNKCYRKSSAGSRMMAL